MIKEWRRSSDFEVIFFKSWLEHCIFCPYVLKCVLKGVGGVKVFTLFFLSVLHMLQIYLSLFQKVLTYSLILDGSDFIDIWRLVVGAKNGLKIGQKYSVLTRKLKTTTLKTLLLITAWSFYLKICTKVPLNSLKNLNGADFWIFAFFAIARQNSKNSENCHFRRFLCYK